MLSLHLLQRRSCVHSERTDCTAAEKPNPAFMYTTPRVPHAITPPLRAASQQTIEIGEVLPSGRSGRIKLNLQGRNRRRLPRAGRCCAGARCCAPPLQLQ
jgi:hypothetical protein